MSGELDDVELPGRGDDAGCAREADVCEERLEEGAVGGDGAALEREALVDDAAAQVEGLARREGLEGVGLLRALEGRGSTRRILRRARLAILFFVGLRPRTWASSSLRMLIISASVICHANVRTICATIGCCKGTAWLTWD